MARNVVATADAPQAIGPYSQAVKAGGFVFASGQIPLDPASMQIVDGDVRIQAARVLENLQAVLEAAGASLAEVVGTLVTENGFASRRASSGLRVTTSSSLPLLDFIFPCLRTAGALWSV